jgi:hypothetical protein
MASIEKAFPMEGSAIFTEEIPKGVRKEARVVMNKAGLLFTAGSTSVAFVMVCLIQVTKYGSLVNEGGGPLLPREGETKRYPLLGFLHRQV